MSFTQIQTSSITNKSITEEKITKGVKIISTPSYTLVESDAENLLSFDSSTAVTLTVSHNDNNMIAVGTVFRVAQVGTGPVTLSAENGVTMNGLGLPETPGRYSMINLIKISTNSWIFTADI